ncbi:MAG: hypothetical protein FWF28_06580 [Micrococcales bacterium]|nr:hypothetical protein [Micrococcales bacterium]
MKRFGAFFVFAGMAVTGVLWFSRDDGVVRGEDMAALIQRTMDVWLVPRLFGDAVPDYFGDGGPADSFGPDILGGAVLRVDDLRRVAARVEELPQWQNPVWVDPAAAHLFEDGAEILAFAQGPALTVVPSGGFEYHRWDSFTPAPVSRVRTLSSRAWNGAMPFEAGVSLTNEPICRWLDGGAAMAAGFAPWPHGSVWTPDMGARAYTLPFRRKASLEDFPVFVGTVLAVGMEVPGAVLELSPERPQGTVAVAVTDLAPNQCYALARARTAQGGEAHFAAVTPIRHTPPRLLPEGGSLAVVMAPEPGGWTAWRSAIRVSVAPMPAGGALRAASLSGNVIATGCAVEASATGRVYEVTAEYGEAAGVADVLRMWLEVPGVARDPIYVAVGTPPPGAGAFGVTPSAQEAAGLAAFGVSLPAAAGGAVLHDRAVRASGLDAARAVLTNCTTTAYLAARPFDVIEGVWEQSYPPGITDGSAGGFGGFWAHVPALFAAVRDNTAVHTNGSYPPAYNFAVSSRYEVLTDANGSYHGYEGSIRETRPVSARVRLLYPGAYAVTNGHVARVRVFAVYGFGTSVIEHGVVFPDDAVEYRAAHLRADGVPLGGLPLLSVCDESGVDKTTTLARRFIDNYSGAAGFRGIRLNKVHEALGPASAADLTFTPAFPAPEPQIPHAPNELYTRDDGATRREMSALNYEVSIPCLAYVVVVDWRWGFLE